MENILIDYILFDKNLLTNSDADEIQFKISSIFSIVDWFFKQTNETIFLRYGFNMVFFLFIMYSVPKKLTNFKLQMTSEILLQCFNYN